MHNSRAFFSYLSFVGLALAVSTGVASAVTCTPGTGSVTCTGGPAASVTYNGHTAGTTTDGSPFPSTIAVTGGSGTVSGVKVTFRTYTASPATTGSGSADVGILLTDPNGKNLQFIRDVGRGTHGQGPVDITIQDGATAIPGSGTDWAPANNSTWAPTAIAGAFENSPNYGSITPVSAAPLGSATFASVFTGDTVNGNWSIYMADDGTDSAVSWASWEITITFTAASTPSSTSLSPSLTTPFTSGANSSDTLTATVTSGATGTVTFKDGASNLTCTGGNPATVSSGSATCVTTFSTEGIHALSANYSGDGTFVASTGNANIFAQNHATNVSTTYCNTGAITSDGDSEAAYSHTAPYPSVIFVGDGVNADITNSVSTVSVRLVNLTPGDSFDMHMLLVSPDGAHALDFWSNAGEPSGNGVGSYSIIDGSTQLPCSSTLTPGTYGPTSCSLDNVPASDAFTPGPPLPAPQLPSSFSTAPPAGTKSFLTSFVGATAHGAWSLYISNESGPTTTTAAGGWCIDITPSTGHSTTTAVTSNPTFAALGQSVSFTATISSSPTANVGVVTFEENGSPLVGAPNSGVANVSGGQASISTSMLPEGDHTITAMYHDSSNTFSDSVGTVNMRVDKATGTPTLSTTTWTYCNTGAVTIPAGTITVNDFGPAQPNPSNVFVTNLPGTVSSVTVTLKGLHLAHGASDLESLLVGPNGVNPPAAAQTLDFFSLVDNGSAFGPQDTTFEDSSSLSCNTATSIFATDGQTSCGPTSYTSSPFYTLPGTIHHAPGAGGTSTFTNVYQNTNPNGTWSLYFDQPQHDTGSGLNGGWCANFIENAVTGTGNTSHTGPAPSNHMRQGGTGTVTFSLLNNGDFNSNGSTGDPDQTVPHAMTVTGTLPSGLTLGTVPTTPWNCTANTMTQVTCTNLSAITAGSSYPLLTLPVNVASNAPSTATVSGFTFSGAGMTAGTFSSDTITIDPAPILAITKSHSGTFTQGSTATWTLQVLNNSGTAAGATDGSTVTVSDTLPTGYTLSSAIGTNWNCFATSTVTCTTTAVVAGSGTSFPTITLTVNVPAASATSVSNTATVFGGGDLTHTNPGNGAQSTDTVTVVQVPSTLQISAGQTQSAPVGTAFATQLAVTLRDAGGVVIPSYSPVVFTAAAGGGGQSGTFDNATGTKTVGSANPSGVANAGTFTANSIAGAYTVGVTAGSATATFNLTNTSSAATVTNVTSTTANGSYGVNAMINVTITFSKVVNVTGTPTLALNSGGTAGYVSGSGTANISFLYTVGAGQNSAHLDATSTTALSLNGGSIQDSSNTAAILTLPAPGAAGSLGANKNIVIDTTSPTVVSYSVDFGVQTYNLVGASRTTHLPWSVTGITVVFSKPIATANAASLGGISATGLTGLGTNTLTWTFSAITNATLSTTLAGTGVNAIKDAAGNALAGGAGFTQAFSVLYGDFNGDGVVNASDGTLVNNAIHSSYNILADLNGDGVVNATDVNIARTRIGATQQ